MLRVLVALMVMAAALLPGEAIAAKPDAGTLTVNPSSIAFGESFTVAGAGYAVRAEGVQLFVQSSDPLVPIWAYHAPMVGGAFTMTIDSDTFPTAWGFTAPATVTFSPWLVVQHGNGTDLIDTGVRAVLTVH